MGAAIGSLFQPLQARGLDLPDLVGEQAQPCPLAPQLGQCVRRHRIPFRRGPPLEPLRGRAQGRLEAADAEASERALDPVADARAFAEEFSRSRLGRLASSSSRLGIAAMPQCSRSPRSRPRKLRFSSSVSSRSVFARRCSRETAMLFGWITPAFAGAGPGFDAVRRQPTGQPEAVAPRLEGDRDPVDGAASLPSLLPPAMQPPSRPASLGSSFFAGCRSIPGTMAAPSQLDWLISITAINVSFSPRAASDLLMSLDCGIGHPVGCLQRR
jgi:hypothetical protein